MWCEAGMHIGIKLFFGGPKEKAVLKLMKELPENLNQRCRGA
jgi:hypothetical protein